jgi:hypothetical protein
MECLEFRRVAGADPHHLEPAARQHAEACPRCAEYLRQTLALDERILAALKLPVSSAEQRRDRPASPAVRPAFDRRRWLAFAASIVAGVLVGTLLWVGEPRDSLAADLVSHIEHEPQSMASSAPAAPGVLDDVLAQAGIRLRPEIGTVSYAHSCPFHGHTVPHLVVQTAAGPVTVMVLPDEPVKKAERFSEQGYSGTIVPAGPGSIAVVGTGDADLTQVVERVLAAVEWVHG